MIGSKFKYFITRTLTSTIWRNTHTSSLFSILFEIRVIVVIHSSHSKCVIFLFDLINSSTNRIFFQYLFPNLCARKEQDIINENVRVLILEVSNNNVGVGLK